MKILSHPMRISRRSFQFALTTVVLGLSVTTATIADDLKNIQPDATPVAAAPNRDDAINWATLLKNAKGAIRYVSNAAEFNKASATARPGDVIIIRNGTYDWSGLNVVSKGTANSPVTYMAETSGQVTFAGGVSQVMKILGHHNIIGGFVFDGITERPLELTGPTGAGTTGASDNRITDIAMRNCGKARPYWMLEISRRANRNRIDHSVFDQNYGHIRLLIAEQDAVDYGPSQDTRIDHNVFKNTRRDNKFGMRVPVLQIGQGSPSQKGSDLLNVRLIFEYNTISNHQTYYVDGLVSVKSSHNIIRHNRFVDSHGAVGLRDGEYNEVYGNYFSGKGGDPAIYLLGAYHRVYNNIIDTPERSRAIVISRWGKRTCPENPDWCTSYPPTHDLLVVNNTILNFREVGIDVGQCDRGACEKLSNVVVANNIIVAGSGTLFRYDPGSTDNLLVSNNLYFKKGTATCGRGCDMDQHPLFADPRLTDPLTLPAHSPAINAGLSLKEIRMDFNGRPRNQSNSPDIGAIEH